MALKSLITSSIYTFAEQATNQSLTQTIMAYSLRKNGTIEIEYEMIEDVMSDITSRTSPYFAKYAIDKLVKSGKIKMVYNDQMRLTNAIPFFRKQENGRVCIVVNITNFCTMHKDGRINIAPNTLYAMLLSAAFGLIIDDSILSYARDTYMIYARLFTNIISNLAYVDQLKREKLQYLTTNFYFYNIYGPDKVFTNPYGNLLKYNSKENIAALDAKFKMYGENSSYEDLKTFIESLVRVFPEMKKVTFQNFVDRWSLSYGSTTMFAPEYIPYFFYMLISTACLSGTVNVNKITTEIGVNLNTIYKKIEKNVSDIVD